MIRRVLIGGVFLFLVVLNSLGQQQKIDSLRKVLGSQREIPALIDTHIQLSFELYDKDIQKAFEEASLAHDLAKSNNYPQGDKFALSLMGLKYFIDGDHLNALSYYRQSDEIENKNPAATGYNWILIGNVYRVRSSYDTAVLYYDKAIKLLEKENNKFILALAYKNLGLVSQARFNLDEAEKYFNKCLDIRTQDRNLMGIIDCQLLLGTLEVSRSNFNMANKYFETACQLIEDGFQESIVLKVQCYFNDGIVRYKLGDYEDALLKLFRALDLVKGQNFTFLYAQINMRIADVYADLDQFDLALTYMFGALQSFEKLEAKKDIGSVLSGISWIYKGQLNFKLALEYIDRSQKVRESIHDTHGISNCHNIRGLIFFQQKKYNDALKEMDKALEIRKAINYTEGVADVMFNMALVFEEQGDLKKALSYQLKALEMEKEFGSDQGLGISYNAIGELYIRMNDLIKAQEYLDLGIKSARKTGSNLLLRNNYLFMADLHEKKKDFEQALHYRKLYDQTKDSVFAVNNSTKVAEMQALYQVEQKNQEIAQQENQLKLQNEQIEEQNIIITSVTVGIILISILAYIIFMYYRNIRKANREIFEQKEEIQAQSEELIEANETIGRINKSLETKVDERTSELKQAYKELDTFFYRSSHDFRRPLTTFLGLAEVAKVTVKDENALELFNKVKETAVNLDRMLVKLQSISDLGTQQLVYKEVFVKELISQVLDGFNDVIVKKDIQVSLDVEPNVYFYSYPALVKIIVENLVENAVNFCGVVDRYVKISATQRDGELTLEVRDNGQGIAKEYHDRIFDMYFRANQNSKGNGLGLYIVKKSVEKLGGHIHFTSTAAEGAVFTVTLPSNQHIHTV